MVGAAARSNCSAVRSSLSDSGTSMCAKKEGSGVAVSSCISVGEEGEGLITGVPSNGSMPSETAVRSPYDAEASPLPQFTAAVTAAALRAS